MPVWLKVLLLSVVFFICLLFVGSFYVDEFLGKTIKSKIFTSSNGNLAITYSEINVDILGRSVYLSDVLLNSTTNDSVRLSTKRFAITNIDASDLLFSKELAFDSLNFEQVMVELKLTKKEATAAPFKLEKLNIAAAVQKSFNLVQLNHLHIVDLKFIVDRTDSVDINGIVSDILVEDIKIDSANFLNDHHSFFAKRWKISLDTLYNHVGSKTTMLSKAGLIIEKGMLTAKLSQINTVQQTSGMHLSNLTISNLDLTSWKNHQVSGQSIELEKLKASFNTRENNLNVNQNKSRTSSAFNLNSFSAAQYLPAPIKRVNLDKVLVGDFEITSSPSIALQGSLNVESLIIDYRPAFSNQKFLHTKNLALDIQKLRFKNWQADKLTVSAQDGRGVVKAFGTTVKLDNGQLVDLPNIAIDNILFDTELDRIVVDQILVENAKLKLKLPEGSNQKSNKERLESLYPYIANYTASCKISSAQVNGLRVELFKKNNAQPEYILSDIRLDINNVLIEKGNEFANGRLWHTSSGILQLGKIVANPEGSNYQTLARNLIFNTQQKSIALGLLEVRAKDTQFPNQKSITDRYIVDLDNLMLTDVDYSQAIRRGKYLAAKLTIDYIKLVAKKDKRTKDKDELKPMPQEWFLHAKFPFSLNHTHIKVADIRYEELHKQADQPGVIEINSIKLNGRNFSNIPAYLKQHPVAEIAATGKIENAGAFSSTLTLYMLSDSLRVDITGTLDTMDLRKLNHIAQFAGIGMIDHGQLLRAGWNFTANKYYSFGELEFLYNDLKIQVNTGDRTDTTGIFQDVLSGLVNFLVVDGKALPGTKDAEPKKMGIERNPTKGFFNYYWNTIFSGIKKQVGAPSKNPEKLKN